MSTPTPVSFVPIGLVAGLAGAALTCVGLTEAAPAWTLGVYGVCEAQR